YGFEADRYRFGVREGDGRLARLPSELMRLLDVVERAGVPVRDPVRSDLALGLSADERRRLDAVWRTVGIAEGVDVFALAPGSKMPAKRWPIERFAEVGRGLRERFPRGRLVVLGGAEDRELGNELRRRVGDDTINLAGDLSILESAEALRRCRLYIGNDTGTMHLAAAVGTPCVTIFSARDHPGRWEPHGAGHISLRHDLPCAGCLLLTCEKEQMACIRGITPDHVLDAVS